MKIKNNKKGGWGILSLIIIPIFLAGFFFFNTYTNTKDISEKRIMGALDSLMLFVTKDGKLLNINDENGENVQGCWFPEMVTNNNYNIYKTILLEEIPEYNEYWEINVTNPRDPSNNLGIDEGWYTFKYLNENLGGNEVKGSNVLKYKKIENTSLYVDVSIQIRAVVPKKRISNYDDFYSKEHAFDNVDSWHKIELEVKASCF